MSDPTDDASSAAELEFDCPLCGGAFEISSEWLGHEVECPHCNGTVALEGAEEAPATPEALDAPAQASLARESNPFLGIEAKSDQAVEAEPDQAEPEQPTEELSAEPASEPPAEEPPEAPPNPAAPPAPLTVEQKAALRRRVNLILSVAGAVTLVLTFLVLSWLVQ